MSLPQVSVSDIPTHHERANDLYYYECSQIRGNNNHLPGDGKSLPWYQEACYQIEVLPVGSKISVTSTSKHRERTYGKLANVGHR